MIICANYPSGNSKLFRWKSVKLSNGKGAQQFQSSNHDEKILFVMNKWQTLSIISFTAVSTLLFHLGHLRKEVLVNWIQLHVFNRLIVLSRRLLKM